MFVIGSVVGLSVVVDYWIRVVPSVTVGYWIGGRPKCCWLFDWE